MHIKQFIYTTCISINLSLLRILHSQKLSWVISFANFAVLLPSTEFFLAGMNRRAQPTFAIGTSFLPTMLYFCQSFTPERVSLDCIIIHVFATFTIYDKIKSYHLIITYTLYLALYSPREKLVEKFSNSAQTQQVTKFEESKSLLEDS